MALLTATRRTEDNEIAMEVGGAIYFAIFITIGAFIGLNLFVVVVTTNLEQMMKTGEEGQQRQITFSEVHGMGRTGGRRVCMNDLCTCVFAHSSARRKLNPKPGGQTSTSVTSTQ